MISGHCRIRVRYSETDAMAVAHHSRHVAWLEVGRMELMRAAGMSYTRLESEGISLPLVGLELRYRAAARMDDIIEIETAMEKNSAARVAFTYRMTRVSDGVLLATARTEHAAVDNSSFRPIRLPAELVTLLQQDRLYPPTEDPC
jgi:acyl-CoA thioester hydrolase